MAQSSQQFYNLSTQNLLRINYAYCICTYCMCGFAPGLQKKKQEECVCVYIYAFGRQFIQKRLTLHLR